MMFHFPSVTCTRCTGFFCLAIIKGPPNDIYCIIEEPYKHYFTEKIYTLDFFCVYIDFSTDLSATYKIISEILYDQTRLYEIIYFRLDKFLC